MVDLNVQRDVRNPSFGKSTPRGTSCPSVSAQFHCQPRFFATFRAALLLGPFVLPFFLRQNHRVVSIPGRFIARNLKGREI